MPKYVDAIQLHALSRRVSGLRGGGGAKRNRRRIDGSLTDFDLGLHRLAAAADGCGAGDYARRRASRSKLFRPNLYCACAQTAISQLLIEILTSPLDSAIPIS